MDNIAFKALRLFAVELDSTLLNTLKPKEYQEQLEIYKDDVAEAFDSKLINQYQLQELNNICDSGIEVNM